MDNHFFPLSSISFMLCLCYFIKFTVGVDDPASLPGDVSISCGSVGAFAAQNGRQWLGDTHPTVASYLQINGKSTISSAAGNTVSADPIPYKTARISSSGFSYVFLVNPGEKFIRLHFNPTPYKGFQKYKDFFSVEAGPFTLLSNFSASLTADALGLSSVVKEFCISVEENQPLHIVFSAASSLSGDTYAFLNGIEIITVPSGHSYFHDDGDIRAQVVGHKSRQIYVDNSTALEMVRRVNIKRDSDEIRDKFGMWGTVLREKANQINNIEWKIPVDVGFRYLIRLHFSYLGLELMQETGSANFELLINGVNADNNIDLVRERDIYNIIAYKDYIVMLKGHKHGFKHDIVVSLRSYHDFFDGYGPFTGFEILKLSNLDNSLACPNPLPPAHDSSSSSIVHTLLSVCGNRNVIVTISITIITLANIIIHKLREFWEASCTEEENKPSARAERFCRHFSLAEMKLATENFSYHLIIGKGGFGKVYKGLIDHGKETVAIKRLKAHSSQGALEFLTEIDTLSELRHINLVPLIGYCNEQGEMILVYEYMAGGTLGDHLYKLAREGSSCTSLAWKPRLNICIGACRGLDYLHTGHGVIHRDVKASNILLDENFTPKVSDFGLVKHENLSKLQTHVSTKVKGTFGYLDPAYFSTGKLTRKSDIYAFGVVLLEVLCGRPAIDRRVCETEQILTKWAREKIKEGEVELIVDSNLKQEISPNSLKAFVETVERCLDDEPKTRPTMAQVVLQLEFCLDQQDIVESLVPKEIADDASCTDETNLSVVEQATWINERIPTSPPKDNNQIDSDDLSYRRKKGRKSSSYKPARIWPWEALWKRVKPSRKNENSISEICEEDIKLPKYDWSMIESATDHFSSSNRVGDGTSYYKAVFRSGQIVVVKILPRSQRRAEDFLNEILMVQNLQHRNILKLLGYCIHKEKLVLVHEFMENRSLDEFIFGKSQHLGWTQRFKIIKGIARGLVYLHEDSGMKIIPGGLKPNHILLDINMNPKISGFGSAQTVEEDSFESMKTGQYAMDIAHLCPEYLQHGKASVMTDVYSFGIVVLETVSGRKCVNQDQNIVYIAYDLWKNSQALELMHESIRDDVLTPVQEEEVLRCMKVGLLCTQYQSSFRPTMPHVIKLLKGELSMELQGTSRNYSNGGGFSAISSPGRFSAALIDDLLMTGEILPATYLKTYSYSDLKSATRNFKPDMVLGVGGFGTVYKGWVDEKTLEPSRLGTGVRVAVKKLNSGGFQGFAEWQAEVKILGRLSHPNLVKLLGYCWEDKELLLVYEFMLRGSLENHLFRRSAATASLSWDLRLKIVIGAARGLAFLHTLERAVIYRDFKASTILLDGGYNAKLSGFGLAKLGPSGGDSHVSTQVMGTHGYAAPEYIATGHLYVKSDVYGFGVVLLEMLTGLRAIDNNRPSEQKNLVEWLKPFLSSRQKAMFIMDPKMEGQYSSKAALLSTQLTLKCLEQEPKKRPAMKEVVEDLEQIAAMAKPRESKNKPFFSSKQEN